MVFSKKQFLILAIGLAMAVTITSGTSFFSGFRRFGDHIQCAQNYYRLPYHPRNIAAVYPACGPYKMKISRIEVLDHSRNKSGHARITSGGVNFNHVKLYLGGPVNQPINFTVIVYGEDGW